LRFFQIETIGDRTRTILTTLRSRRARGEQVAMTQIIAKQQFQLREQLHRIPKLTTTNNETRIKHFYLNRK
jgi:hypothetical protein